MKKIKKIIFSVLVVSSLIILPVMATGREETAEDEPSISGDTGVWSGWTEEKQNEAWEVFTATSWDALIDQMVYH